MEPIRYRTLLEVDYTELVQPITSPAPLGGVPGHRGRRLRLRGPGAGPLPGEPVPPAARLGRGLPDHPHQDHDPRPAGAAGPGSPPRRQLESGLVLVTGPTGSGKSTTLAAIIDLINETRNLHIITIEDPIEFVHPNKKCLIHQREIGAHATQLRGGAARRPAARIPTSSWWARCATSRPSRWRSPAAEKGTIVFGTLHTNNAAKTIDRIINVFPAGRAGGRPQRARRRRCAPSSPSS